MLTRAFCGTTSRSAPNLFRPRVRLWSIPRRTTVVAKTAPAATATAAASMTVRYARRERFCVASHRSPMPSFHASAQPLDDRPEHRACMSLGGQASHCPVEGSVRARTQPALFPFRLRGRRAADSEILQGPGYHHAIVVPTGAGHDAHNSVIPRLQRNDAGRCLLEP